MGFPGGAVVKNPPSSAGEGQMWVQFLALEYSLALGDPLEKEIATHSSIPAWRIPWTEEPGGLQPLESQRVGHDWANEQQHCLLENLFPSYVLNIQTIPQKHHDLTVWSSSRLFPLPGIPLHPFTFWWTHIYFSKPSMNITCSLSFSWLPLESQSWSLGSHSSCQQPHDRLMCLSVFPHSVLLRGGAHLLFIFVWAVPGTQERREKWWRVRKRQTESDLCPGGELSRKDQIRGYEVPALLC